MKITEKIKMDLMVKSRNDYKKALMAVVDKNDKAVVLDLGCGEYKRLTKKIKETIGTDKMYGIDLDVGSVDKDILVYQGDLNKSFPMQDGVFDVVVASQIIEHLWNTDGFLKEIRRCLKPTGYAVISTPNLSAWYNRIYLLLGKQPEPCKVSEDMFPNYEKPGHLRIFTESEFIKFLRFHGFKVEKVLKTFGNITVKVRKGQ